MKEAIAYTPIKDQAKNEPLSQTQAEQLLREFIDISLKDNEVSSWKPKFQILVRKRLTEEHPHTYFRLLGASAETLVRQKKRGEEIDCERETVLSNLLLYEFFHRDAMPDTAKGYNKTVFTRFLLTHQTDENQLGVTAKNCVDQLSLQELSDPILNPPRGVSIETRDKLLIGEVAITRLGKKTDLAKTILDDIVTNFIRNLYQDFSRVQSTAYTASYSLLCYSPELADYIVQKLSTNNHQLLSQFFTIYEQYKDKNPADVQDWQGQDTITNIKQTFERCSQLQLLYKEWQAELVKSAKKDQVDLESIRTKDERKINDTRIDHWLDHLPKLTFYPRPSIMKENTVHTPFGLPLFIVEKRSISFNEILMEINMLFSRDTIASIEKKDVLQISFDELQPQLIKNIETVYLGEGLQQTRNDLVKTYSFTEYDSWESVCDRASRLDILLTTVKQQLTTVDHSTVHGQAVAKIHDILCFIAPTFHTTYEKMKNVYEDEERSKKLQLEERREKEKQEKIKGTKKEYLIEEIEQKTDYLKTLYELHSGLNLHEVDTEAVDEDGITIGAVSVGYFQRQRLIQRQEQTLAQKLEFKSERDIIELEMGEDLATMIKRHTMVDWVAAHEIAHLIDLASGHFTEKALHANITKSQIDDLITTFTPEQQSLAKEMITRSIKESFIDGVGFYCGMTYGTSNIVHDNDQSKRVENLTTAFCTTMEIVKNIIQKEEQDKTSQSGYQLILLRFIATTHHLTKNAETNNLTESLATLSIAKNTLTDCFYELNENTRFISEEQKEKLVDLFYQWFKGGESFLKDDTKQ